MMKHIGWLRAATALSGMIAVPALAQTVPAGAAEQSGDQAAEIIVTARRVEERLQDVPISISVFNQQQLSSRNVSSGADLATYTPSLTANTAYGTEGTSFSIRGFSQEIRTTASVAFYFADVVAPRSGGSTTSGDGAGPGSFFDLQNVQVLKGPQGTLFGRNTTGGAILLVPQKPTGKLEGYVEGSYGNYDMNRLQAVLNVPLSDIARLRVGVDRQQRDGYQNNISGIGPKHFADIDYVSARASLIVDLAPNLENYTILTYARSDTNGSIATIGTCFPGTPLFGQVACAQQARLQAAGHYAVENGVEDPGSKLKQWQAINTTTWQASDAVTVKNILSYAELTNVFRNELFGTFWTIPAVYQPFPGLSFPTGPLAGTRTGFVNIQTAPGLVTNDESTFSEEFQVQGRGLDDRLVYQGGVFYSSSEPLGMYGNLNPVLLSCSNVKAFQCFDVFGTLIGAPGTVGTLSYQVAKTSFESFGVYGQATYSLTDRLKLTGGLRYTRDGTKSTAQKAIYRFAVANTPVGFCQVASVRAPTLPIGSPADCTEHFSVTTSAPTWLIDLDYKPHDAVLLYAKYSRGYRQGAITPFGAEGFNTFKAEKVDSYETGVKASWRGAVPGHLNLAAFYNDFTDQQIQVGFISSTGAVAPNDGIVNAGSSRIYGTEIEASLNPFAGFTADVSYAYLNAKITKIAAVSLPATSLYDTIRSQAPGTGLKYTPRHKVSATATYRLPLSDTLGRVSVSATYTYTGRLITDPSTPYGTIAPQQTLNMNLAWNGIAGAPLDLSLFATNLTNNKYYGQATDFSAQGFVSRNLTEPRMYGARLRYRFGA